MLHSSIFGADPNSFTYRNIVKTAEDFAFCSADAVRLGNDIAIQNWLTFSYADWGFLAVIVLLVMSFLEEKKKGLTAIARSCPAGRGKLQGIRMWILLLYCATMTFLLYYLPLMVSLTVHGGWHDLSRPVQSLMAFQKCTAQLTVGEFFMQFFFLKTVCGFFIGMLIWFALSFLEQVQLCWMVTAAALVAEYFLHIMIPAQSVFRLLRYVNIFSYVFTSRIYTEYVNLNFFSCPIGKSTILLWLLFIGTGILTAVITTVLPKRYPFGNRDLLGRWIHLWDRIRDALLRRLGMVGFEWYKLLLLTGGGIVLLLGLLLSRDLPLNSGAYNRIEDAVYRQYVAQIQGPVTQSTYDYIARAKASLEDWQIDRAEFETALNRLEQTVADMPEGTWLIDDTTFLNIFASKSWRTQRNTAWMALLILCTVLAFLFSPEQNADLRRMLRCTPRGRERLFWTKYGVAFGVTILVWLMVFVQEWYSASKWLDETVLAAPCASVDMIKNFPGTVRSYLMVLCVIKGIALLIPMNLCVFIGEKTCNFEKSFLVNGAILLIPAAVYMFGVHDLKLFTPVSLLADGSILLPEADTILIFAFWMAASIATLIAAKRDWVSTNR